MNVKLLDCTLRDGGYVNDWNFGRENIAKIINQLIMANIDIIEIGFLNQNIIYNSEKTIVPDMKYFNELLKNIDRKKTKLFAMIEYGTFDIEKIPNKEQSLLDGIRVIFDSKNAVEGFSYCNKLKEKKYMVSANIIKITNCNDEDFLELFKIINKSNVDVICIVDTYGHFDLDETKRVFKMFDENISENIAIGFHAHNTLQLATGNCLELIRNCNLKRIYYIDGTLNGMGKGAGNAYTEVLAKILNKENDNYKLQYISNVLTNQLEQIKKDYKWGFSIERFVSSISNVHYNFTEYYRNVKNLEYEDILKIEKNMKEDEKHNFSEEIAEKYYLKYLNDNNIL